ncbi:FecR domain-containing protein, partial [Bacteroides caccae]
YNIDIEFRNSEIMNLRMHFLANRQQKVSDLIELLNRMERIHVYLEGESLIIE